MATEFADRFETNTESGPSQTVVTSSIVIPTTSKRSGRQDALPKRRASNELVRQNNDETKRPRLDMNNKEVKKRSRKMFGVLLDTLTKFKNESQNKTEAEIKREQIERKLQEKLKKEHEELQENIRREEQERRERIVREKREAEEKRTNEAKICWATQKKNLANFLRTSTQPSLYYLPAKMSQSVMQTIAIQKRQVALESSSLISHSENEKNEENNIINDFEITGRNNIEKSIFKTRDEHQMEVDKRVEKDESKSPKESTENDAHTKESSAIETMETTVSNNEGNINVEEPAANEEIADSKDDPVEY
ncbi:pinin/SDK/memA/ protein conserved region-domain-containing protein [Gigaspora rosea]|uniref:Pinin/SDK/memA/ protein conserved region-domain-containing protein n=1 Tax=Gigaspora rosea TaxID=44941 RepID=A0A397U6J9_9GLOM|nr:pinin/SDK/memA/ protein conserved region-domain-containing protein [Gigaspora rosea]